MNKVCYQVLLYVAHKVMLTVMKHALALIIFLCILVGVVGVFAYVWGGNYDALILVNGMFAGAVLQYATIMLVRDHYVDDVVKRIASLVCSDVGEGSHGDREGNPNYGSEGN